MRFLHTADWHVGRTIRGRSRADEFAAALDEVVAIAVEERVDAVLLAGDVYEHRAPGPEADELVFDAFVRLHEAGIRIVEIPGNHDSAARPRRPGSPTTGTGSGSAAGPGCAAVAGSSSRA